MSITYKLTGAPEMGKVFQALADAVGVDGAGPQTDDFKTILLKPAEAVRDDARTLAPSLTGKLRSAIFAAKGAPDKPGVIYGVNEDEAPYAPDVEFGTSRMAAHPFMRPAVAAQRADFPNNIASDVGALLEGVANKNACHPPE